MAEATTTHPHSADLRHPCIALVNTCPGTGGSRPRRSNLTRGQNTDFDRKVDKWSLLPWPKRKRETLFYVKNSNVIHN